MFTGLVFAQEQSLHCQDVVHIFTLDNIILRSHSQQLILLENIGQEDIILDKVNKNVSASAGWASELAPNHYSILATNQRNFALKCLRKQDYSNISCKANIKVCQINNIAIGKASKGSYWVTENAELHTLSQTLKQRGFIIR